MANANKRKGDRAERAVRDWAIQRWPESFKTRAGFNEDLGDVILTGPAVDGGVDLPGRVVLQVKDVASPKWTQWFSQLADQVATAVRESAPARVIGGVIVHKTRGSADPGQWRAVATLEGYMSALQAAYEAGLQDGARR